MDPVEENVKMTELQATPPETTKELNLNEEQVDSNENDVKSKVGSEQEDKVNGSGEGSDGEEAEQELENGDMDGPSEEEEEENDEDEGSVEAEEGPEEEEEEDGKAYGEGRGSNEVEKEPITVPVQTPNSAKTGTVDIGMSPDEREKQQDEKFDQLEKEFQKTFFDMAMDESASKYRTEFNKLHRTLIKYRENEKRLVKKCKDLNGEMVANAEKVQAALKLSQNDRSTIATLKKEIKKAWKMVETSNEKEARAKDAVSQMKQEVSSLSTQGETQHFMSPSQEKSINDLIAAKEELMKERDQMNAKLEATVSELTTAQDKLGTRNTEHSEMEHEINTLKDLIATKKSEADREARSREKLEKELREVKAQSEQKSAEYKVQQGTIAKYKEDLSKLDVLVREQKQTVEKASKDQDNLAMRNQKLQMDYEEQILSTTQLLSENQSQALELKIREDDFLKLKEDVKNINRVKDSLAKKVKSLEENKEQAERERDSLKSLNYSLEREQLQCKQQGEVDRKQIDELVRERDILNKNFIKSTGATTKQANLVKLHEQTKRNLEQEIQGYKDEASKQRKLIYALEKDRDRHINESAQNQAVAQSHLEDVKIKELQLFDYKKKITEAENKLKQQQQLYENARSDRNLYSKNLIESQDEIIEMKRKLKIMTHQIDQLKEEITAKEAALVKEHFEHLKVEKEKDGVKMELTKLKQQNDLAQQYIQSQQAEEHKLRHIITEADAERLRQKKEYDAVIQERDILGTQLIRRNDELALVYEKIKIQQSTLNKGEIQYRERLEDIRVLKLEIKKLRREKVILQHETANVEQLRNEIYRLQRELLRERTRVKVLEEELENPINIHRWRKLEGSDPSTFEMVQKVQTLQKRLIAKTEEVVEKELMIQAREKMYQNLKSVLVRCPGPEVAEQITVYQQNLKEKTSQVKALASELNMHQAQGSEFKYEIERLNHELVEVKKRYYEQKRKEQQARFAAPMEIVPRAKNWTKGVALGAVS